MVALIAAIADDYTGASDLANTWRKLGLRTVQTIGIPSPGLDIGNANAIAVSLKIRSVPAAEAVRQALAAYQYLRGIGASHVMYKICSTFDSTAKGNIGPVTDALRNEAGGTWTLVTPAFPETGRTVYKSNLFVGDVPLNESPLKVHPLNPMHDANLVRVMSEQTPYPVESLSFQSVKQGAAACRKRIADLPHGPRAIIADAIADDDLDLLGELALSTPVSTGASGLGAGLAKAMLAGQSSSPSQVDRLRPAGGHAAILAGSCSARTLEQIAAAERHLPVLRLDAGDLIGTDAGVRSAVDFAIARLQHGPVVIAASGTPASIQETQRKFGTEKAGRAIEQSLATISAELVEKGVRRFVVAGGETSGAVVDMLGIEGFEVGEELAPGVPMLRTLNRPSGDLLMVLKSGNFGGVDFFSEAIAQLR